MVEKLSERGFGTIPRPHHCEVLRQGPTVFEWVDSLGRSSGLKQGTTWPTQQRFSAAGNCCPQVTPSGKAAWTHLGVQSLLSPQHSHVPSLICFSHGGQTGKLVFRMRATARMRKLWGPVNELWPKHQTEMRIVSCREPQWRSDSIQSCRGCSWFYNLQIYISTYTYATFWEA